MTKEEIKILKNIVSEGYKLKAQHNNNEWRVALEDAEELLIKVKNCSIPAVISSVVIRDDVPDGYWYSHQKGNRFNIRHTHKSELRDIEGFGHCYGDDCWAVADGEFKGNVMLRQHCL